AAQHIQMHKDAGAPMWSHRESTKVCLFVCLHVRACGEMLCVCVGVCVCSEMLCVCVCVCVCAYMCVLVCVEWVIWGTLLRFCLVISSSVPPKRMDLTHSHTHTHTHTHTR